MHDPGETIGAREAMDRFVRDLVRHGADPAEARKRAKEVAERHDQRNQGKTRPKGR